MKHQFRIAAVYLVTTVALLSSQEVFARAEKITRAQCEALTRSSTGSISAEVVRVVDGDTIKVSRNARQVSVRLLSIDTPETHFQGKSQGYWGDRAAAFLAAQVSAGSTVRIEFDRERCDKFGRILGHVFFETTHLNRLLIEEGLAVNYCIFPNISYCAELAELAQASMEARRGFFSDPTVEIPYVWRKLETDTPWDKWVGNQQTQEVFPPSMLDRVPVAQRVFFMTPKLVKPPYKLISSRPLSE